MKFNEQYTVENYVIKFLKETLGYEYIKPQDFAALRQFESEFLIIPQLLKAVMKINNISEEEAQNVVREIKKIDNNEDFLELMRSGVNLVDIKTRHKRDYKVVDFENIENNLFVITNQFYFEGNSENIRPDILVFLNGLPIADIEAKSPTAGSSVSYENAIDQIKRYEKNALKLFLPNCFNLATDGLKTVYGATYSPKQYFFEWKDADGEIAALLSKIDATAARDVNNRAGINNYNIPIYATARESFAVARDGGADDGSSIIYDTPIEKNELGLEITLMALLEKTRLLDIIKNYIVFEKAKEQTLKKICRYQQMRAANKIIERVQEGKIKKGLIWHTQGSGKSLTMFFTAWKLRFAKELKNPKVFILVDRNDLDDQITDTFLNCGGQNIIPVISKRDLAKKIMSDERGIFISTIQKFNDLPAKIDNPSENIIVLCDEGHRGNEGFASINLRSSMKNAFFFGFTGTPVDKLTLNTHRNFGEEGERYLDYYSIQQSIEDGATLPVTYEARLSKFFIDEEKIDQQFNEITNDLNQAQKDYLAKKYGKKEAIVKLEKRMRAVIQDIVEHYKLYVLPNGFKAQIVCYDREATAKYKQLLDKLAPKEWSEVVYSPGDPNSDSDDLKAYNTNKRQRDKIINNFKSTEHPLKFLLVCDMLLTGFDAPIEQVMYLDKQLRDHNLLQAIARTNRVYPNKGCGKIIDYYGITRNLEAALNFDESIVDSAMINIDKVKEHFVETLNDILRIFAGVNFEDPSIDNLRRCLKIFIDNTEKQNFFQDKYTKLKLFFEILSPDPFLKKHLRQFEWITSFYLAFVKEFKEDETLRDAHLLADYGGKLKILIQEKIDYEGITKNFRELKVNDLYVLERLKKMDDEEKALNLEKMLKREISINLDTNPAFKKFSERLTAIKKEFEQHQIDLAERIKKYYELLEEIKGKNEEASGLGFTLGEYGLYAISEEFIANYKEPVVKDFIREMSFKLSKILDKEWQESSKRDYFLKEIKRTIQELTLKDYKDKIKINDFSKYLNRMVDIIVKKF